MLATIVLLLCLASAAIAAGILFVLFGPVPVNRRVTMVSRIQPVLPIAAGPIAMPGMQVFDPAQAHFTPAQALPATRPAYGHALAPDPADNIEPPRPAPRKAKPLPPIAPVQLRRPRTAPSPLPRTRSARGTHPRPNQFEVEHTARETSVFELDDPTFIEDGH